MVSSSARRFALSIACLPVLGLSACTSTGVTIPEMPESPIRTAENVTAEQPSSLFQLVSENNFEATVQKLKAAIDTRGFKTFAVVDHAAGAASVDQALAPTTLIIFGNPQGGTPLMQSVQTMGLELPLKMLVTQNKAGVVEISWANMADTFQRYGVEDRDELLKKISGALETMAREAAS